MRIVYLNPVGEVGGAERSLLLLMTAVDRVWPGIDRTLIVGTEGPLCGLARAIGVQVHLLPLPEGVLGFGDSSLRGRGRLAALAAVARRSPAVGFGLFGYVRRLRNLLDKLRADLVHSNGMKAHVL